MSGRCSLKRKPAGNDIPAGFLVYSDARLLDEAEYLVDVHVIVVLYLDLDELAGGGSVDWLYSIVGLDIADRGAFLELGADSRSRAVVSDIVSPDQLALGHSPGEAEGPLYEVRQRAGLTDRSTIEGLTQSEMRDRIFQERRMELAFEGHRWFDLIRKAAAGPDAENYYTLYHLALNYYCRNDFERAEQYLRRSLALRKSRWALHALANVFRVTGRLKECAELFRDLVRDYGTDLSLVKEAFKNFSEAGAYAEALEAYHGLPDASKVPLVRFFYAEALAHSGNLAEAEDILFADGGIEVPDIREGENSTSAVYLYIQKEKAHREGKILKDDEIEIPFSMDLRMTVPDPRRKQQ